MKNHWGVLVLLAVTSGFAGRAEIITSGPQLI
jgi:hypothetical protein